MTYHKPHSCVGEVIGQSAFGGMGAKYILSSFPLRSV
ncbi:mCG133795 [Mus musculus]|nr:mCG133795 [Mus musculus]